jgi:hypothetical protein
MNLRYEIWPVDEGFGYTIFNNDTAWIVQPHDPTQPGFVSMDAARAEDCARQILAQLQEPEPQES